DVVLVEGQDVADEGVELDEHVAEARDLEVGPDGEHALHELDEPGPQRVEVLVGVVHRLGQQGHGRTSAAASAPVALSRTRRRKTREALSRVTSSATSRALGTQRASASRT